MIKSLLVINNAIYFFALLLGILASHPAIATTINDERNFDETQFYALTHIKYDVMPRSKRLNELKYIETVISDLNSLIPTPTPEEIKWINSEKNAIKNIQDEAISKPKEAKLYTYSPYIEMEEKSDLNSALFWAGRIRQANNINTEMVYWIELVIAIRNYTFMADELQTVDNIPVKSLKLLFGTCNILYIEENKILAQIIMPYLQNSQQK